MSRAPIPLTELSRRLPEAGRIRTGHRSKQRRNAPAALERFRFTSKDRESIEQVASIYGGKPQPWNDAKWGRGQWEVYTEADTIQVALPPDPLGGTPIYELWSGGGCQRRCTGKSCEVMGHDGVELAECICARMGELTCKLKTRLNVILPDVRLLGTWRLETGSENAARELPGMVDAITTMQGRGINRALLRLVPKTEVVRGQTKNFIVPTLGFDATPEELAAGAMQLAALPGPAVTPPPAALGAGAWHARTRDDEIVEAEIVPEDAPGDGLERPSPSSGMGGVERPAGAGTAPPPDLALQALDGASRARTLVRARELAQRRGDPPPATFEEITEELAQALMDDSLSRAGFDVEGSERILGVQEEESNG